MTTSPRRTSTDDTTTYDTSTYDPFADFGERLPDVEAGADVETTGDLELDERRSLRRVAGLSTELEDVTEVEYRRLRLERVVLVGVWPGGDSTEADNSLAELA